MDDLAGWNAQAVTPALVVPIGVLALVISKVVRQRPAILVEFDASTNEPPSRQVVLVMLRIAALRVEHLQRDAERACVGTENHAKHELAVDHGRGHCCGLQRAPGLHASHIARIPPRPEGKRILDGGIGMRVEPTILAPALCLQKHPARASHVRASQAHEGARIVVVARLFARPRHQHALVLADDHVSLGWRRGPVGGQPVNARSVKESSPRPRRRATLWSLPHFRRAAVSGLLRLMGQRAPPEKSCQTHYRNATRATPKSVPLRAAFARCSSMR